MPTASPIAPVTGQTTIEQIVYEYPALVAPLARRGIFCFS